MKIHHILEDGGTKPKEWQEGHDACLAGKSLKQCPYKSGTQCEQWKTGWTSANLDRDS